MRISKAKKSRKHIPFEIQIQIIRSLPIKSLIRFRSVSKPWNSLIGSSEFLADYHNRHTQPQQHLLVRYTHSNHFTEEFFSIADNDDFPSHKFDLSVPLSVKRLSQPPRIFGSSQGLICFYNLDRSIHDSGMAILWNPLIRKSIAIPVPNVKNLGYQTVVGFGVCRKTIEPKLVKISYSRRPISLLPWKVKVFTLSSRVWRRISINLPRSSIALRLDDMVVIDGVIYWHAFDRTIEVRFGSHNLVVSFDLTSEEFTEIHFPQDLALRAETLMIYKPTESLAVVENHIRSYDVWIMDHGVPKSFSKLFTVREPSGSLVSWSLLEIRKNGEAVMQTKNYSEEPMTIWSEESTKLEAYEPVSKHLNDLGICRVPGRFSVTSYTESLLLLDQPEQI